MERIGFVGFGSLGQLLGKGFSGDFDISYYDPAVASTDHKKHNTLAELVNDSDIIMIATPSSSFGDVLTKLSGLEINEKLIVDVLSAKTYATQKYKEIIPNAQILSLHPLFGPPSYTQFEPGLRVVSCLKKGRQAENFEYIMASKYNFKIISKTAEEHDKHMAVHHALPFILAHTLAKTDFKKDPGDLTIPSEEKLRKIVEIAGKESQELYYTIIRSNPYAKEAVEDLLKTIQDEYKLLWP